MKQSSGASSACWKISHETKSPLRRIYQVLLRTRMPIRGRSSRSWCRMPFSRPFSLALRKSPDMSSKTVTTRSPAHSPWRLEGLTVPELGRRLWHESREDELFGRAAQLSYYALLALFPALIFLTALMGLFSVQNYMPELMSYLRNVLPADALSMVRRFLSQIEEGSGANILSLGALGALWASSSGVTAIMDALNVVYDVKDDS